MHRATRRRAEYIVAVGMLELYIPGLGARSGITAAAVLAVVCALLLGRRCGAVSAQRTELLNGGVFCKQQQVGRGRRQPAIVCAGGSERRPSPRPPADCHAPCSSQECGPADAEHLSETLPAHGLHVLRAHGCPCCDGADASFAAELFVDGSVHGAEANATALLEIACAPAQLHGDNADAGAAAVESWLLAALRKLVQHERPLLHRRLRNAGVMQPTAIAELNAVAPGRPSSWAFFSPHGTRIPHAPRQLLRCFRDCAYVYVFEGGQFQWPAVRVGYSRMVDSGDNLMTMTTRSLWPNVLSIAPLLSPTESAAIIAQARPLLTRSLEVADGSNPAGRAKEGRTSMQTGLPRSLIVQQVEDRAHRLVRIPYENSEPVQVLRYRKGERYANHNDFFSLQEIDDTDTDMQRLLDHGRRNRLATMLWHLQTPAHGGRTNFPRAGGLPEPDTHECAKHAGLKLAPKSGEATLFYNLRPDGVVDPFSLHAGCPPRKGVK